METKKKAIFSQRIYRMANQYKMGQPVTIFYRKEIYLYIKYISIKAPLYLAGILFGISLILLLFFIILYLFFASQRPASQLDGAFMLLITNVYSRLKNGIFIIIMSVVSCGGSFAILYAYIQNIPESVVICEEGMLIVWPKRVEAIYWDEVRSVVCVQENRYKLCRDKIKDVYVDNIYDNMEDLFREIRYYTKIKF